MVPEWLQALLMLLVMGTQVATFVVMLFVKLEIANLKLYIAETYVKKGDVIDFLQVQQSAIRTSADAARRSL